ncbi:MAG: hypothetical protein V3U19_03670 [Thermodesulfobacteriota bacterium]
MKNVRDSNEVNIDESDMSLPVVKRLREKPLDSWMKMASSANANYVAGLNSVFRMNDEAIIRDSVDNEVINREQVLAHYKELGYNTEDAEAITARVLLEHR